MPPCLTPFVMRKLSDTTNPSFLSSIPLHNNSDKNQGRTSRRLSISFLKKRPVINSIECFRGIRKTHVNRPGLRMIKINNLF